MGAERTIGQAGGEFALIKRALSDSPPQTAAGDRNVLVGASLAHDGALLRFDTDVAVTTDMLIEGRHFRFDWISAYDCGWRCAAASVSDCAAMAAWPRVAFLSIGLPPECPESRAEDIIHGVRDSLAEVGAVLAGGDTVATNGPVALNVCLLAEPAGRMVGRAGARPGDLICVTGRLGASRSAVLALEKHPAASLSPDLVQAYARPHTRVPAGVWLSAQSNCHAMMDLSDGLASDLGHIAATSGVGIVVQESLIPVSELVLSSARLTDELPVVTALVGGEDYELVFAAEEEGSRGLLERMNAETQTSGSVIGRAVEGSGVFVEDPSGHRRPLRGGYQHFPGDE
ncbi:MAG: thiamine-phosphate kinase [Armatimonadetes bacterium]|nr:thiamine-phosphate kinase [Armatimonadota bacterium]